jgi:hypothetical protein
MVRVDGRVEKDLSAISMKEITAWIRSRATECLHGQAVIYTRVNTKRMKGMVMER